MASGTMKHFKSASSTETIVANAAGSTSTRYVVGPANDLTRYGGQVQGRYILESSGTYRWVEDYPVAAAATVSRAFTADLL